MWEADFMEPDSPDINFTTSHEFAVAFLEHLDVRVDYFDWHFYAANGWNGKYDYATSPSRNSGEARLELSWNTQCRATQ